MKSMRIIWVLFFIGQPLLAWSQAAGEKFKMMRSISNASRSSDPEKAIQEIEATLAKISSVRKKSMERGKFMLSYRLVDLFIRTGQYQKAEAVLVSRMEEVRKMKPSPLRSKLGFEGTMYDSFEKLGYFYLKTGNLRKADQVFKESKTLRDEIFSPRSVHRIQPMAGEGSLQLARGQFEATYKTFNAVELALSRAMSTDYDYDNIARLYLNDLVELCFIQNKHDEAWSYINKLSIASSGIGKFGSKLGRQLETARILELKARYYVLIRDYSKAQEYLDKANKYYSSKIATSDIKLKLLKTQAVLYWQQGYSEMSNETFLKLIQSYQLFISQNFLAMTEYEKEQFYSTLKNDFNLFNAYTLDQYAGHSQPLMEAIYNSTLNMKALLLNESNKIKNNIIHSGNRDLVAQFHKWEDAKAALSSIYYNKNALQKVDSLEADIERLEKTINQQTQLFARTEPVNWQQVKAKLASNEAAIEMVRINTIDRKAKDNYYRGNGLSDSTVYLALIIKSSSTTPEPVLVAHGNELEQRLLAFYRNSIENRTEDNLTYDKFWFPIKQNLKGITRIYFSPDGIYNQINLNTLYNPVTKQYLIDELELISVTNTGDLLKKDKEITTGMESILVGRPDYDFQSPASINTPTETIMYGQRNILVDELAEFKEQEFKDLPGTEAEIDAIEEILTSRNMNVRTFKGSKAREENVKSIVSPSVLHIATHGFFVDDSASQINPMIRSGLILAGVKGRDNDSEDGILTAYEATNLNLDNTSLVALSACETGLGEVRNGEGVYGLQRAIMVAGAHNLLMSLWKVDDEATAALMGEFYRNWNFTDNQQAFRKAQLALRQKYSDPYYWGAFIMLGK